VRVPTNVPACNWKPQPLDPDISRVTAAFKALRDVVLVASVLRSKTLTALVAVTIGLPIVTLPVTVTVFGTVIEPVTFTVFKTDTEPVTVGVPETITDAVLNICIRTLPLGSTAIPLRKFVVESNPAMNVAWDGIEEPVTPVLAFVVLREPAIPTDPVTLIAPALSN
jgi:hypothetical protein